MLKYLCKGKKIWEMGGNLKALDSRCDIGVNVGRVMGSLLTSARFSCCVHEVLLLTHLLTISLYVQLHVSGLDPLLFFLFSLKLERLEVFDELSVVRCPKKYHLKTRKKKCRTIICLQSYHNKILEYLILFSI